WIYFTSAGTSDSGIWRVAVAGGPPERLTRDRMPAFGFESLDGRDLLYKGIYEEGPLLALLVGSTGPARQILPCVSGMNFAETASGLYYAECGEGPVRSIHLRDRTGRDRVLGHVHDVFGFEHNHLAVSPDGKTVLVQQQTIANDLWMVENF